MGKKALRLLAIILLLTALTGAGQSLAQPAIPNHWDIRQRLAKPDLAALTRLRFLTTTEFFPFNFIDQDGRLSGFHIDLSRALCRELSILDRCQIQALPFDELASALERGDGEAIVAGFAVTREAREKFIFSRPYLQFPARFLARNGAVASEESFNDWVGGKRVGVMNDTAHEQMLRDLFPRARVVTYSRESWLMGDLARERIDAVFGDGMRLAFHLAGEEGRACCTFLGGPYLAPEYLGHGLAIAVARDKPLLAAALDYALREVEAKGTLAELYLRYFPVSFY